MEKTARYGVAASAAGIFLNIALAGAKLAVGGIYGLVSVIADGFNNLSDCGSSVVSIVSFKVAEKPADKEHPYGHRRAEYVAAMVIGFLILFVAAELLRESVVKVAEGTYFAGTYPVFIVLGISVAVKGGMFVGFRIAGNKLNSDPLRATSTDSLCDCVATLAVIAGALISDLAHFPADGWASIVVSLFIAWEGLSVLREASSKLLGQAPDKELVKSIQVYILGCSKVLGIHDLRVYAYGRDAYFATVHVEMDASIPSLEAHAVLDGIEQDVQSEFGVTLTVHLDPVDLNDSEALALEKKVRAAVAGISEGLDLHDFRLVRCAKNKLEFDVGVPFACKLSNAELGRKISDAVRAVADVDPVIKVERE